MTSENPSRCAILAGVASASVALPAVAAAVPLPVPVPALPLEQVTEDPVIALAEKVISLDRAYEVANEAATPFLKMMIEWQENNPMPEPSEDADAIKRWGRRKRDAERRCGYRAAEIAEDRACKLSADSIEALCNARRTSFAGLAAKARASRIIDSTGEFWDWQLAEDIASLAKEAVQVMSAQVIPFSSRRSRQAPADNPKLRERKRMCSRKKIFERSGNNFEDSMRGRAYACLLIEGADAAEIQKAFWAVIREALQHRATDDKHDRDPWSLASFGFLHAIAIYISTGKVLW
jgi:hypothetical protein